MKAAFWVIGKTDAHWLREGMAEYEKRLPHYLPFEYAELPLPKLKGKTADAAKAEAHEVLKRLKPNDFLVLLDERGTPYSSTQFAQYLEGKFNSVAGTLVFLVGGAYGFSEELYARANDRISLSKMTFTHQMVRLIFLEQLYRAMTILRNEPYHH